MVRSNWEKLLEKKKVCVVIAIPERTSTMPCKQWSEQLADLFSIRVRGGSRKIPANSTIAVTIVCPPSATIACKS
jgi:hypothetical protein